MVNEKAVLKLKSQRFLVYTGKISYGLYCFHGIVLTFGMAVLQKFEINLYSILRVFLFLCVNYLIATISYQFVEKPFLQFKDKLRRA
jgi:peptidoglycan/LPS O-acetylase OafA/YrhL